MWDPLVIEERGGAYKNTHIYKHRINWCHNGGAIYFSIVLNKGRTPVVDGLRSQFYFIHN